jgi:hypothetical protein
VGEISFFEDAALSTCLARVLADIGASAGTTAGIGSILSVEASTTLNDALVRLCRQPLPRASVDMREEPAYSRSPHSALDFRIRTTLRADGKRKMWFIRVKDSAPKVVISLVALSLALWLSSPRAITDVAALAYTIYEHIVTLESPQDDDAMSAFEALLKHAAELAVDARDPASHHPTARLKAADLAEVVEFGGKGGDYGHEDNRWAHRV